MLTRSIREASGQPCHMMRLSAANHLLYFSRISEPATLKPLQLRVFATMGKLCENCTNTIGRLDLDLNGPMQSDREAWNEHTWGCISELNAAASAATCVFCSLFNDLLAVATKDLALPEEDNCEFRWQALGAGLVRAFVARSGEHGHIASKEFYVLYGEIGQRLGSILSQVRVLIRILR